MNPDRDQTEDASAIPVVSVVIPTFNRVSYIGDAVESVLAQTFRDFEIIVVDDGSTDGTSATLRTRFGNKVRCLVQPNRGVSAALNAGIRVATGRYIARLDSDDIWHRDLLSTLVPVLDAHPDVGVVYAKAEVHDGIGATPLHIRGLPERYPGETRRSLLYEDCTAGVAMLTRRTCLDRAGVYDESLLASEDWDMSLRLAGICRFQFVDRVVARIRLHGNNMTGIAGPDLAAVLACRTIPLDKFFSDRTLPDVLRRMRGTAYANVHTSCGLRWFEARQVRLAMRQFVLAIRASDGPVHTLARIIWFAAVVPYLSRARLTARLVLVPASTRQRLREWREGGAGVRRDNVDSE
jgi:glycosyltransferase involved in cell wall biosynthesis